MLGVRIVRIAVHPSAYSMGYGTEALNNLVNIFKNNVKEIKLGQEDTGSLIETKNKSVLFNMASSVMVPQISWIGSSFGLTERLFNFWKRGGFLPICTKQQPSKSTGENSIVVLRSLHCDEVSTSDCSNLECTSILEMNRIFSTRFIPLLGYSFKEFSPTLTLSLIHSSKRDNKLRKILFTKDEVSRLEMFSKGLVSARHIMDIMPNISKHFFFGNALKKLSILHQSVLVMIGCQYRAMDSILKEFNLEEYQLNSLLMNVVGTFFDDFEIE